MAANSGAPVGQEGKQAWRGQSTLQPVADEGREPGGPAHGPDCGGVGGTLLGSDRGGVNCKIWGGGAHS